MGRGEGHEKKSIPNGEGGGQNFIYESIGGVVTNMISISFSGIKMLWLPDPLSCH